MDKQNAPYIWPTPELCAAPPPVFMGVDLSSRRDICVEVVVGGPRGGKTAAIEKFMAAARARGETVLDLRNANERTKP